MKTQLDCGDIQTTVSSKLTEKSYFKYSTKFLTLVGSLWNLVTLNVFKIYTSRKSRHVQISAWWAKEAPCCCSDVAPPFHFQTLLVFIPPSQFSLPCQLSPVLTLLMWDSIFSGQDIQYSLNSACCQTSPLAALATLISAPTLGQPWS